MIYRGNDIKKCKLGVYRVFWKSGGSSVASIGQTYNGTRWMAPANWTTSEDNVFTAQNLTDDEIKGIEKIILITT